MASGKFFVGIDIGGTFTDVVVAQEGSPRLYNAKKLTTPDNPSKGVMTGLEEALAEARFSPRNVQRIVHATTLATNLILERRGARVGYITTQGFGDMFVIGQQRRTGSERYDLFYERAEPFVSPSMVAEVTERMNARGEVLVPLDENDAASRMRELVGKEPEAIAICFLNSYANPVHEQKVAALARELCPGTYIAISSEVWPEYEEYSRASTTVMSAYVGPVLSDYIAELGESLKGLGITSPLQIMQSNGGIMSAAEAARKAVYSVESGPAAGVIAATHLGRLCGHTNLISFDMGGTTAKAGLIREGKPSVTRNFRVGGKFSVGSRTGEPIKIPVIDLAEVGAGGGSIAWVDAGGGLQVGPQSAGAAPGPACYGFGGDQPTVTDANVVLGYLNPDYFLGGKMRIHPEKSRQAIARQVAEKLKLDVITAARGIYEIANSHMGSAVRVVTVQRGIDPRAYAVMAFGGAGPVHIVKVAEQFEIPTMIVPPSPGLTSALGLLFSDLADDHVSTHIMPSNRADVGLINRALEAQDNTARENLRQQGLRDGDIMTQRFIDTRFRHQAQQLPVPIPDGPVTQETVGYIEESFRKLYLELFGVSPRDPCELVNFRVRATGAVAKPALAKSPAGDGRPERALKAHRQVYFAELQGFVDTLVYDRARLQNEDVIAGPAIIEEPDSTTVCPPGYAVQVDAYLNQIIRHA